MARSRGSSKKLDQHHVRLHLYEMNLPAYRTLSCDARALLIELRSLYSGRENEVFLSLRDMQERLNISQRPAQNARDELLVRGWVMEVQKGSFSRKKKLATVYALTHVPLAAFERGIAPKYYLKWQPGMDFRHSTVGNSAGHSSQNAYRGPIERQSLASNRSQFTYQSVEKSNVTVVESSAHLSLPPEDASAGGEALAFDSVLASVSASAVSSRSERLAGSARSDFHRVASIVGSLGLAGSDERGVPDSPLSEVETRGVGHSISCNCGGRTRRMSSKVGIAVLTWQECGCCGRAERHHLDDGAGATSIGAAAKARFALLEHGAAMPGSLQRAAGRDR